jgi:hypothetical protein
MLEHEIEKKVCDYAREKGFEVYKFSSPNRVGVPDRMFVAPYQRVFWIEFKSKGKQPTPVQEREARKLTNCGFDVYLIDNVEDGKEVIDNEARNAIQAQHVMVQIQQFEAEREAAEHGTRH